MKRDLRLLLLTLLAACATSPREPSASLSTTVTESQITIGQFPYDTIVVTLRNLTADSLTLHFGAGCQLTIEIRNSAGQRVAPPAGNCVQGPNPLSLAPHEALSPSVVWAGGADWVGNPISPLSPGTYSVYASLVAAEVTLQAQPVPVQLSAAP